MARQYLIFGGFDIDGLKHVDNGWMVNLS